MVVNQYAAWLRDEHQKVADLSAEIRDHIVWVPYAALQGWLKELTARFEKLRAHLQKHMALEEKGGYLSNVLELRPTLSDAVAQLRNEHRQMSILMDGICVLLSKMTPNDPLLAREACKRIMNLLNYVEHHNSQENLIVLSVFTDDIGTKD